MPEINITQVEMQDGSTKTKVESPFHPDFPEKARDLGGQWNSTRRAWYFDTRDADRVRDLCREIFGTDGNGGGEVVDCHLRLSGQYESQIWFAGRKIAGRFARDARVSLGEGVVIVEGKFKPSGGSRQYPSVSTIGEVTLEIRDVPLALAVKEKEDRGDDSVTILAEPKVTDDNETVRQVVPPAPPVTVMVSGPALAHLAGLRERLPALTDEEIVASALNAFELVTRE